MLIKDNLYFDNFEILLNKPMKINFCIKLVMDAIPSIDSNYFIIDFLKLIKKLL